MAATAAAIIDQRPNSDTAKGLVQAPEVPAGSSSAPEVEEAGTVDGASLTVSFVELNENGAKVPVMLIDEVCGAAVGVPLEENTGARVGAGTGISVIGNSVGSSVMFAGVGTDDAFIGDDVGGVTEGARVGTTGGNVLAGVVVVATGAGVLTGATVGAVGVPALTGDVVVVAWPLLQQVSWNTEDAVSVEQAPEGRVSA